jgi:hypothetical protein
MIVVGIARPRTRKYAQRHGTQNLYRSRLPRWRTLCPVWDINIQSELQILRASAWYYTPLQLQPDSSSSCNWYTLWVANTERFRLILYHPLSCNQLVVRVAIDVHSELQIPSAFSCNRTVVRVAINVHSELQILRASAWYYTTPPLQLQPDSGSSCNWYTLRVANTKRFRLILYYPFSCNPTVVGLPSCN